MHYKEKGMNYSQWLLIKFPALENESSVKTFNYIKKAKKETKHLRLLVTIVGFVTLISLSYFAGYYLSRFTEIDSDIVTAVCVAVSLLISSQIEKKITQKIVQNKLIELVDKKG